MTSLRDEAYGVMCSLVLEDGRRWGETAGQFQRKNALDILDVDHEVRQSWIELPRGARKTTDLAGLLLSIMAVQAPAAARLYIGASDLDQAREVIDAASGLIARTPELGGLFEVTGLVVTCLRSGSTLTALPADASAMGKRAYLVVLDELANWPDTRKSIKFWDVLMSGTRKIAACRTVVITNAGSPAHWSFKRREVARSSPRWRFCSVPGPLSWLSPDDLAVLMENATTPTEYERLHLNRWAEPEDQLATRDDVEACVVAGRRTLEPVKGQRYVISADLSQVKDFTVVSVLHVRPDGSRRVVVLDRMRVWKPKGGRVPLDEVRRYIVDQSAAYFGASVVMDAHQARLMIEQLQAVGVQARGVDFTAAGNNSRASLLLGLLREHRLELVDDEELVDELAALRLRETSTPGVFKLDTATTGAGHFDRATALSLGAEDLLSRGRGPRMTFGGRARPLVAMSAGDAAPVDYGGVSPTWGA